MSDLVINRPDKAEYQAHYGTYVSLVPDGHIVASLDHQLRGTLDLLRTVPESRSDFRYAPGKWSVKQLVGHVIDTERIFAYRALRFARGDRTELPGFEGDDYVRNASFDEYTLNDLAAELESVRRATVFLFRHLDREAWDRKGLASGNEITVRALAYIIAGHELHHRQVLRVQYLAADR